ncbi:MAG: site-specific integrase [Deltaproteobacteria bacterium]|nr:site-specific integrase [Kofleriaceae bacterium]
MPVKQAKNGRWRYREVVRLPDGTRERVSGTARKHVNTKVAAQQAMRAHVERILHPERTPRRKEVPTFEEWFNGRFWKEWVVARKNKPTEVRSKTIIFAKHLEPAFGAMPLDEIDVGEIARFRARLVEDELSEKRINNILVVLSKALRYAHDCELIAKMPKIGLFKVERPEIVAWDFEQYARLLATAKAEGEDWYAAVCLAGEAGLRVGEVKELRWREDVDMIARTITVNRQTCDGQTTTPKGRTRRVVPMTDALHDALKRMSTIREGYVVRNVDGSAKRDGDTDHAIARICRKAGLPTRYWHTMRHSYGTHAALFGVNPWRLQTWLGHKRIDETMLYVHVAEAHAREIPEHIQRAADGIVDADKRVLAMLGARGNAVAKTAAAVDDSRMKSSA